MVPSAEGKHEATDVYGDCCEEKHLRIGEAFESSRINAPAFEKILGRVYGICVCIFLHHPVLGVLDSISYFRCTFITVWLCPEMGRGDN